MTLVEENICNVVQVEILLLYCAFHSSLLTCGIGESRIKTVALPYSHAIYFNRDNIRAAVGILGDVNGFVVKIKHSIDSPKKGNTEHR